MINPYFNNYNFSTEQTLVDNLLVEAIQMFGLDITYIVRDANFDPLLGEDAAATFSTSFPIEMYVKDLQGWQGGGDMLAKFGIEFQDRISFWVSKTRWEAETANTTYGARPREGDLIYLPFSKAILQIRFVENEAPFYQGGINHVYEVQCEKFIYNHERFSTGNTTIDGTINQFTYTQEFVVDLQSGSGTYQNNEPVSQNTVFGVVQSWDGTAGVLTLRNLSDELLVDQPIVGQTSGAHYVIATITPAFTANTTVDNAELVVRENDLIDFSESNPFSEPV